ncbi:MAG: hypothetical protein JNL58_04880 [Planctomyces sp.]|nr:hypothetical protein [Planctomyces sp.]
MSRKATEIIEVDVSGHFYEKSLGVLIRFFGRAPVHAIVYRIQKLRCHLCGKLFTL